MLARYGLVGCYLVDHGDGELIGWDIRVDRVCLC